MIQVTGPSLSERNWQKLARGSAFQPSSCMQRASPDHGHQVEGEICMLLGNRELSWAHQGQDANPLSFSFLDCCSWARAWVGLEQVVVNRGDMAGLPKTPK